MYPVGYNNYSHSSGKMCLLLAYHPARGCLVAK